MSSSDMRKLIESLELLENLGNITQLNVGWMTDILKQDGRAGIGKNFVSTHSGLGNTSEVVDVGAVKNIASVRKAMRDVEFEQEYASARAFALHVDNQPVMFALIDSDALRTKRERAKFAYDLNIFKDSITARIDQENTNRPSYQRPKSIPNLSTQRDHEDDRYDYKTRKYVKTTTKLAGVESDAGDLTEKINEIFSLADESGKTVTMKIASNDRAGNLRGQERRSAREIAFGVGETLAIRLKKYKNSKRPTAQNVEEFIRMAMNKEASVINFAGGTYSSNYHKGYGGDINVVDLMNGKPFKVQFKSQDPDRSYDTFDLHMRYVNGQLIPWQATYYDENRNTVTEPLDLEYWVRANWKADVNNKEQMMRSMLTSMKDSPGAATFKKILISIRHMRKAGIDWPELDVLARSVQRELEKDK